MKPNVNGDTLLLRSDPGGIGDTIGAAFDRLFLQFMIKHHEGALIMVEELFAQPGAGQEGEIFAFASDVDADQRMEIDRMRIMLDKLKER